MMDAMRPNAVRYLPVLFVLSFVALYILPLGLRPMIIPDEARYAEIPREMIASGDWVVPRLNGLRYFEKPALGYWQTALSMTAFGRNAWASRLPVALAAGLSAWLVFALALRGGLPRGVAFASAAVLLTAAMPFGLGVFNVLDGPLTFWLTLALFAFFQALENERPAVSNGWKIVAGVAVGGAFLTKGFLALAVTALSVGGYLIVRRQWRALFRLPWLPLAAALVVVMPWALAVHRAEPDYWTYFFWIEHINRFLPASAVEAMQAGAFVRRFLGDDLLARLIEKDTQHPEPFGFYIPVLLAGLLPWTFLLPAAIRGLRRARPWPRVATFALCAFALPFAFFSASGGKLATYILPCFPPLALLLGWGLTKQLEASREETAFTWGARVSAVFAGLAALVLAAHALTGYPRPFFDETETAKPVMLVAAWAWWAALAWMAARPARPGVRLARYACAPLLLLGATAFVLPNVFAGKKAPVAFFESQAERIGPDAIVVSDDPALHGACWAVRRDDLFMLESRGELAYGLDYPDARHRHLTHAQFSERVNDPGRQRPIFWLTDRHTFTKASTEVPPPDDIVQKGKFLVLEYR